ALDSVLKGERLLPRKLMMEPILPPPLEVIPDIDRHLIEIEDMLEQLHRDLIRLSAGSLLVSFARLAADKEKLEVIRTFILLLFLAQRQQIWLLQEEEFGEIYISVGEKPLAERNTTSFA
ncbi:MAG: segregation/condensation protein A, partial [Candidatus Bathyarchaeota archaeon]|nr:segregation/condensation protein A [Candidatus Bathyarchaeota archaeon]